MSKNKNNKPVWSTRIKKNSSSLFAKVGSSINIDKRLYKQDIYASTVHVEMLFKKKIISLQVKNKIIWGLKKIFNEINKKKFTFNNQSEDIHMSIEKRLFDLLGEDAGFIHTARSRNDQVIVDFKLWMIDASNDIVKEIDITIKSIIKIAEKNIYTIMPSFTHLKNAQPISFAHYILAYVEMLSRDKKRFLYNKESLLENPLGVAAIAGTSFDIDREFTTKKLKFKKPTNNSVDTVSDRDFVLDFLYSISVCSNHISRFAEEFILWNSDAFDLIKLKDKVVTGSSIMPQKKNPDTLEYLRGKTGHTYGNLFSMLTILKGLPLSYFKDLQDDKELAFKSFDQIKISLQIMREVLNNFIVNKKKMIQLAETGYTTATDLADYIVREHKYPFRKAYLVTSKIVNLAEQKGKKLNDLTVSEIKSIDKNLNESALKLFNLENSVKSKKSYGGTSFENIKKMIKKYKKHV